MSGRIEKLAIVMLFVVGCVVVPEGRNSKRRSKAVLTEETENFGQREENVLRNVVGIFNTTSAALTDLAKIDKSEPPKPKLDATRALSEILEAMGVGRKENLADGREIYRNRSAAKLSGALENHAFGIGIQNAPDGATEVLIWIQDPAGRETQIPMYRAQKSGDTLAIQLDLQSFNRFMEAVYPENQDWTKYRGSLTGTIGGDRVKLVASDIEWATDDRVITLTNYEIEKKLSNRDTDSSKIAGTYRKKSSGEKIADFTAVNLKLDIKAAGEK